VGKLQAKACDNLYQPEEIEYESGNIQLYTELRQFKNGLSKYNS